jgi:1,4-alpha-glucan branching enzyme
MDGESAPMGANLTHGGATFRIWAPTAQHVAVAGTFNQWSAQSLNRQPNGYWYAFVPGAREGDQYKFEITGTGSAGLKRDPYGRSRTWNPPPPKCNNYITHPSTFPWHDRQYRPPRFEDLVIYQLHVGAFYSVDDQGRDMRAQRPGRYLDILYRLEYLASLGITAIQLLPVQEFDTLRSLGYNTTDFFAPELDYVTLPLNQDFRRYFDKANELLTKRELSPYLPADLDCQTKQLMALIDLCHVYGVAVLLDVVYNHAGGNFDEESLYFLDRQPPGDNNRSLYFTDQGWAGGLIFAYWQPPVRQFLIDNAGLFLDEYHIDGFRFDEVTVIDNHGGWSFLQNLTGTLRYKKPSAFLIAEYWADQSAVLRSLSEGGAGFDAVVDSGLRNAIRKALVQAAVGRDASVDLDSVAAQLRSKYNASWRSVQHLENQDIVRVNNDNDRQPRIPALADGSNARSWYARSRSRWANGLLLVAPGVPMLFMGQELLEDKYWTDSPDYYRSNLIWWDGLDSDRAMQNHLRFTRELLHLRLRLPALRSTEINIFHVHNANTCLPSLGLWRWPGRRGDFQLTRGDLVEL